MCSGERVGVEQGPSQPLEALSPNRSPSHPISVSHYRPTSQIMGVYELQPALYKACSFPAVMIRKVLFKLVPAIITPSSALASARGKGSLRTKTQDSGSASCSDNRPDIETKEKEPQSNCQGARLKSQPCHQPGKWLHGLHHCLSNKEEGWTRLRALHTLTFQETREVGERDGVSVMLGHRPPWAQSSSAFVLPTRWQRKQ